MFENQQADNPLAIETTIDQTQYYEDYFFQVKINGLGFRNTGNGFAETVKWKLYIPDNITFELRNTPRFSLERSYDKKLPYVLTGFVASGINSSETVYFNPPPIVLRNRQDSWPQSIDLKLEVYYEVEKPTALNFTLRLRSTTSNISTKD